MKNTLLLLLLVLISCNLLAQSTLRLQKLESLCTLDGTSFYASVSEMGYKPSNKVFDEETQLYLYRYPQTDGSFNQIARTDAINGPVVVSSRTTDSTYFKNFNDNLISSGFQYTEEDQISILGNTTIRYFYFDGTYTVILYTLVTKYAKSYNIQVYKDI